MLCISREVSFSLQLHPSEIMYGVTFPIGSNFPIKYPCTTLRDWNTIFWKIEITFTNGSWCACMRKAIFQCYFIVHHLQRAALQLSFHCSITLCSGIKLPSKVPSDRGKLSKIHKTSHQKTILHVAWGILQRFNFAPRNIF